jgi:hypothetical protein
VNDSLQIKAINESILIADIYEGVKINA